MCANGQYQDPTEQQAGNGSLDSRGTQVCRITSHGVRFYGTQKYDYTRTYSYIND